MTKLEKLVLDAIENARKNPEIPQRIGNIFYTVTVFEDDEIYLVKNEKFAQKNISSERIWVIAESFVNYIKAYS